MGKKLDDLSNNRREKSIKSYASQVFQESLVGTISCIATTPSKKRKVFKAFVLLFCLTGFLYQSVKFLTVVFTYPTVVDIEVIRPDIFNAPAYTFCNNNGIQRSLFCEKYPDYCQVANESLCTEFGMYCEVDKPMVPKEEYYRVEENLTKDEIIAVSGDLDDFLLSYDPYREKPTGPYMRLRNVGESSLMACYSLNERVDSSLYPLQTEKNILIKLPINTFSFEVKEDELFIPGNWPGILFALHSPFEAVNPFEKGIYMKPGRTYSIHISMEEEMLLPMPYQTDCTNYTELWESNGRKGPRNQEMCRHKCLNDVAFHCFKCVLPFFLYPTDGKVCTAEDLANVACLNDEEVHGRCEDCKDDCHRTKFHYTVQTTPTVMGDAKTIPLEKLRQMIFVKVYLDDSEIVILKHSPKFMLIEVFGTIGGFVGGWLGISLLEVTDIFEGFFRIIRYALKKKYT